MLKTLVLQSLYNLSDDQVEFQIRDHYSFQRFLGLTPEGVVPDAKTVWVFREELKRHGLIDTLFYQLNHQIESAGYVPRKGQIIDASIVEAPRQRNSRDENDLIKSGQTPDVWSETKRRQRDVETRWTKKNEQRYYGYKNHISVDREHKLIRHWSSTPAFSPSPLLVASTINIQSSPVDPSGLLCLFPELRAGYVYLYARNYFRNKSGLPSSGFAGGKKDAFRHCLASCKLATICGNNYASALAYLNEVKGDKLQGQSPEDRLMDDYNNSQGFLMAPCDDCKGKCREALDNKYLSY